MFEDEEATREELVAMITPVDGITSSWVFDDSNSVIPNFEQFATYLFI